MSTTDIAKVFEEAEVEHQPIITGSNDDGEAIVSNKTSRRYVVDVSEELNMRISVDADNEAQARLLAQEFYESSQEPVNSTEE